jgi:hypothetical protein
MFMPEMEMAFDGGMPVPEAMPMQMDKMPTPEINVNNLKKPVEGEVPTVTNITAGFMKAETNTRLYSHTGRADFVKTGTREDFT